MGQVQPFDLGAHRLAELGVQRAQRLVHQEAGRLAHERPRQRHALLVAAAQRARFALEQVLDAQHRDHFIDAAC